MIRHNFIIQTILLFPWFILFLLLFLFKILSCTGPMSNLCAQIKIGATIISCDAIVAFEANCLVRLVISVFDFLLPFYFTDSARFSEDIGTLCAVSWLRVFDFGLIAQRTDVRVILVDNCRRSSLVLVFHFLVFFFLELFLQFHIGSTLCSMGDWWNSCQFRNQSMFEARRTETTHGLGRIETIFRLYFNLISKTRKSSLELDCCHFWESSDLKFVAYCCPGWVMIWSDCWLNELGIALIIWSKSMSLISWEPLGSSCQFTSIWLDKEGWILGFVLNDFLIKWRIGSFCIVFTGSRCVTEVIEIRT